MGESDMQLFISASNEYLRHRTDSCVSEIQQCLDLLATIKDNTCFSPSSTIATQFYISLHSLINSLDSNSTLVWSAVSVLQNACSNENAKQALIQKFKFIPVLSRFLNNNYVKNKQLCLLNLLTELTYGVRISWQEAHLQQLVSTLTEYIFVGDEDLKSGALGVLVNLCYKNLSVLYLLVRKVDLKNFIKTICKENNSGAMRLRVWKMLIILEQLKGDLNDADILNFVDATFYTIGEAFRTRDTSLLKQTLDFLNDVKEKKNYRMAMARYSKSYEDTKRILDMIDPEGHDISKRNVDAVNGDTHPENDLQCISLVLDFLCIAATLSYEKGSKILPRLTKTSLRWIQHETTSVSALRIIKFAAETLTNGQGDSNGILSTLLESLPLLLGIFPNGTAISNHPGSLKQLTALLTVLSQLANIPELRRSLLNLLVITRMHEIIDFLLNTYYVEKDIIFHTDVPEIFVSITTLVSSLAAFNGDWMTLYVALLNKRPVLLSLAVKFQVGDENNKFDIMRLTTTAGWSKESLSHFCKMLNEIKITVGGSPDLQSHEKDVVPPECFTMPQYSERGDSRLNELLDALEAAKAKGTLGQTNTSAVMELYQYKLAAVEQSENRTASALAAADERCTGLNHQVALLRGELSNLHQLLFTSQRCVEGASHEKNDLMAKLQKVTEQHAHEMSQHSKAMTTMKNQLKERDETIIRIRAEMVAEKQKLEKTLETANAQLAENVAQISKLTAQINDLQAESQELRRSLTDCVNKSQQKDVEIAERDKKIEEFDRMREIIINVAARKEKR